MNKQLFKEIFKYKLQVIIITFLSLISVFILSLIPLMISNAALKTDIDDYSLLNEVNKYAIYIVLSSLLFSFCSYLIVIISTKISYKIVTNLRKDVFKHVTNIPLVILDRMTIGEINSIIINDQESLIDGLSQLLNLFLYSIFAVIVSSIMMLYLNTYLGVLIIVIALIALLISRFISQKAFKYLYKQSLMQSLFSSLSTESINNKNIINSFNYEEETLKKLDKINQELQVSKTKGMFYTSLNGPVSRFINNISYILVGAVGSYLIIYKSLDLVIFTSLLFYTNMFSKPINELSLLQTEYKQSLTSFYRIKSFLDIKQDDKDSSKSLVVDNACVEFKNLCFSYNENEPLIENFNLSVKSGQKVAIVGKTGAGKTTLVNLLMRFYEPSSGEILIDGKNIYEYSKSSLRSNIGMVLQTTWLKETSIKDNIMYANKNISDNDLFNITGITNIDTFINDFEERYDTIVKDNSSSISEGQKQLITIARALILDPKIFILDEATSNIDTRSEMLIHSALDEIMKNKTTFVIAHRLKTIKNADLIILLDKGMILEVGNHYDLMNKQGKYYELYNMQFLNESEEN